VLDCISNHTSKRSIELKEQKEKAGEGSFYPQPEGRDIRDSPYSQSNKNNLSF
jgi:hypothetical protein